MDEKRVIDYTKYKLKKEDELKDILKGIDRIILLWCKMCFTEFKEESEEEVQKIIEIAEELNITISHLEGIDFLCNNHHTKKILQSISSKEPVGVISCGIGIQFVSNFFDGERDVFALADSVSQNENVASVVGYHGISLVSEKCAACGECYLEKTGGICPVVNCPKGLLNGPCGGATEDGKCEVNKEQPCVWIEIYKRLKGQKRKIDSQINIRNYNIFPLEEKKKYIKMNQKRRLEGFYGGVYPLEKKEMTENIPIKLFPQPERVSIFLLQHTGTPAKPLVKIGDKVKKGQKIGESVSFLSVPVHSSVSGKVIAIEEKIHPVSQTLQTAVVIENDGKETPDISIEPVFNWQELPREKLIEILKEKGIVGLGGAMFPSYAKLCPPKPVDLLIINGCECEPYLNADNRLMIEHSEELLKGIDIVKRLLDVRDVIFSIEDNKKLAVETISSTLKNFSGIKLSTLKTKYPQGAEKILIKKVSGREVPEGGLPFDVGVVVFNVATLYSIYKAIYEGLPLIERVVTIAGENATAAGNYIIRIGTCFSNILNTCFNIGPSIPEKYEMKIGGPMMGIVQKDVNSAVIKGSTGLILMEKYPVEVSEENICIKCGRCIDVCPMELIPYYYVYYGQKKQWSEMAKYNVKSCIECGCCQYICSSKIDIIGLIKKGKKYADNKMQK